MKLTNNRKSVGSRSPKHSALNSEFLLVKDVAEMLGLSPATIYAKTSQRSIPHYKICGRCYFLKEEIHSFIKSNKVEMEEDLEKKIKGRYDNGN